MKNLETLHSALLGTMKHHKFALYLAGFFCFQVTNAAAQLGSAGENCAPNFNGPSWASSYGAQARSVFKYIVDGGTGCRGECTGMMINQNGSGNPKQYFITSRHCFDDKGFRLFAGKLELCGTTRVRFIFNFQSPDGSNASVPTLATSANPNSGEGNNDFRNFRYVFESEVRIIYYYSTLDVVLGEIINPIPPHFNSYFSGWNPTLTNAANFNSPFVNIHHPRGDIKKVNLAPGISVNGNPVNTVCRIVTKVLDGFLRLFGRRYVTEKICNAVDSPFLVVPYFSEGAVAGGSSGSPLFNSLNRLTGILSNTAPNNNNVDCINLSVYYAKFRNSYASEDVRVALNPFGDYLVDFFGINGRSINCYPDLTGSNALTGRYLPANEYQPFNNRITISSSNGIQVSGVDKDGDGIVRIGISDEKNFNYEGLHIFNNADFLFNANQNIEFGPGFVADAGSTFEARISPCNLPTRQASEAYQVRPQTINDPSDPLTAYPNPTTDEVTFRYTLPQAGRVTLTVADLTGRVVATAVDENYEYKGSYERSFSTAKLPSGVYLYTLRVGNFQQTKRFVVVR